MAGRSGCPFFFNRKGNHMAQIKPHTLSGFMELLPEE